MQYTRGDTQLEPCGTGDDVGNCQCDSDGDCDERPGGECHVGGGDYGYDPGLVQSCYYPECEADADCPASHICVPGGVFESVNHCMRVSCRSNADCRRDGTAGTCVILPRYDPSWGDMPLEAHCAFPESECDVERRCGDRRDEHGARVEEACYFVDGAPSCEQVPDPVP